MTGWRWIEPGPRGRKGNVEPTREAAIRNAVHNALVVRGAPARDIPVDTVPGLWRSMQARGWKMEFVPE